MAMPIKPSMKVVGGPTSGGPSVHVTQHLFAAPNGPNHPNTPNPPGVGGTPMVNPTLVPTTSRKAVQSVTTSYIPFGWTARTPGQRNNNSLSHVPSKLNTTHSGVDPYG